MQVTIVLLSALAAVGLNGVYATPAGSLVARAAKMLYGKDGPESSDADQSGNLGDVGFIAALAALAGANGGPAWLESAMDAGANYKGGQAVETVKFHMWKNTEPSEMRDYPKAGMTTKLWPQGGADVWQPVTYSDSIAGFVNGKQVWWHNGYQQAVIDWLGGKDKLEGKGADQWLAVLANRYSVVEAPDNWERYYEIAQHAPASPVIIGTRNDLTNTALASGSAYSVEKAWKDNQGKPWVRLRSPGDVEGSRWGSSADYDLMFDWKHFSSASHFVDWNALVTRTGLAG